MTELLRSAARAVISELSYGSLLATARGARVLVHHRVSPMPRPADPWCVSLEQFDEQIGRIFELGYRVVSTAELAENWPRFEQGQRTVALVFDDGYRDALQALPILKRYGATATFCLVAGAMGRTSAWEEDLGLPGSPIMEWSEARELIANGMEIGSHSMTHRDLQTLSDDELEHEVRASKEMIAERLAIDVDLFSVPGGSDDPRLDPILRSAGYKAKVTTALALQGLIDGLLVLPCVGVMQKDTRREFGKKLIGAYDWRFSYQRWRRGSRFTRPAR